MIYDASTYKNRNAFISLYCGYLKTVRSLQTESVSMVLKQPLVAK